MLDSRWAEDVATGLLMRPNKSKQLSRSGCVLRRARVCHLTLLTYDNNIVYRDHDHFENYHRNQFFTINDHFSNEFCDHYVLSKINSIGFSSTSVSISLM